MTNCVTNVWKLPRIIKHEPAIQTLKKRNPRCRDCRKKLWKTSMVDYRLLRNDQGNLMGKTTQGLDWLYLKVVWLVISVTNRTAGGLRRKRDYSPLSWEDYFESSRDVCVNDKNVSFILKGKLITLLLTGVIAVNSMVTFTFWHVHTLYLTFACTRFSNWRSRDHFKEKKKRNEFMQLQRK